MPYSSGLNSAERSIAVIKSELVKRWYNCTLFSMRIIGTLVDEFDETT
jgi:hypothetical protein